MKKVLAYALILLASKAFTQPIQTSGLIDGATGNLVYTTVNPPPAGVDPFSWSGFVTTNSSGGGYSGGYQPGYNPNTGTFIFGYGQGTVAYSTPVNYALSMAGTGIQVNGFKYSWEYLNQDYSRGTLSANINLTNTAGQVLQSYNYNMPSTTNGWTLYSGKENFSTQYPSSGVGNLNVSFTGKDDRFWAGYYGPQVKAVDVSLLYSVAPPPIPTDFAKWVKLADENGEFTLSKAGVVRYGANDTYIYQSLQAGTYSCSNSAWGRDPLGGVYKECDLGTNTVSTPTVPTVTATDTTTTDYTTSVPLQDPVTADTAVSTVTASSTPTATTATTATNTSPVTDTSSTTNISVVQPGTVTASPTIVSAPAPATTSATTTSATTAASSSSAQGSTKESVGSNNVSLALSVISKNQERDATSSAVAQSAVTQAQQSANQAQQEAVNIANNAVANSVSANSTTANQQSTGTGIKVSNSNTTNFSLQSGLSNISSISGVQSTSINNQISSTFSSVIINNLQQTTNSTNNQQTTNTTLSILSILQPNNYIPVLTLQSEQSAPKLSLQNTNLGQSAESNVNVLPNTLTDRNNPLTDIIESKQINFQTNTSLSIGSVVNRNVQDNDLANGVSINKMALAPVGYGDYLNFVMKDVAFYSPKEVYKNQKNVDNTRALRQMTNDSKHRNMVDMQYK